MEPKPWGLAGLHGELAEVDAAARLVLVADVRQGFLDDVVRADADAARGDHQVGAHQLVLEGGGQGLGVVGDGADAVGDGTGIAGGRGEGEAVGVVDLAAAQCLAGLDEFAAGGQDDHAGARAHPDRAAADRGEQRDLRRPEHGTGLQRAVCSRPPRCGR
jgi:hypothetical protein